MAKVWFRIVQNVNQYIVISSTILNFHCNATIVCHYPCLPFLKDDNSSPSISSPRAEDSFKFHSPHHND